MQGKVYLCSKYHINEIPSGVIKLLIAIQPIGNMKGICHEKTLAPSEKLFFDIKCGRINWNEYIKRYKKEMVLMKPTLQKIYKYIKQSKSIALICHCIDHRICHRSILGEYLKSQNIDIVIIK